MTPFQTKFHPRRFGALCVGFLLVVAGCSDSGDSGTAGGAADDASSSAAPAATGGDFGPNGRWVQDLWLYESLATVAEDGSVVDLTEQVLAGLGTPDRSVDLPEGGTFHVHDSLAASVSANGATRTDVTVVAGLLEFEGASALAALATPAADATGPIGTDDTVELDVTFLGDMLAPGDPMIVDFAFLQARPAADEKTATGLDLLATRLAAGRTFYYGQETEEGDEALFFEAVLGVAVSGSTRMSVSGKGDISNPLMDGIRKGLTCTSAPIRCVKKYFEKAGEGAKASNELLKCNLGDCGEEDEDEDEEQTNTETVDTTCFGLDCNRDYTEVRGDPHLKSFDGKRLSMQGVGEYVLTRGPELEVQIRTAPATPSARSASLVAMAAMEAGSDHIVIGSKESAVQLWVGDQEIPYDPSAGFTAETTHGSLTVVREGTRVSITAADGTELRAQARGRSLDLGLTPPTEREGLEGLLGDGDGDLDNDWTARDGTVLPPDSAGKILYTGFADSWRVTQEETLLRYGPGESTATFTDLAFPEEVVTIETLDPKQRPRAEAVCRAAGVTQEPLLSECTLDYALSGEMGFVRSAQDALRAAALQSGSGSSANPPAGPTPWATTPSTAGTPQGTTFRHTCPAGGNPGTVWGGQGGTYTDDSSICAAAVHAGLLTVATGGSVQVTRAPGLADYGQGSTRNGVTARAWEKAWSGSFSLTP